MFALSGPTVEIEFRHHFHGNFAMMACKKLLADFSPYFRDIFSNPNLATTQEGRVTYVVDMWNEPFTVNPGSFVLLYSILLSGGTAPPLAGGKRSEFCELMSAWDLAHILGMHKVNLWIKGAFTAHIALLRDFWEEEYNKALQAPEAPYLFPHSVISSVARMQVQQQRVQDTAEAYARAKTLPAQYVQLVYPEDFLQLLLSACPRKLLDSCFHQINGIAAGAICRKLVHQRAL